MNNSIAVPGVDEFASPSPSSKSKASIVDTISFKDLLVGIYRRKGIVLICALVMMLFVLVFHTKQQTFSVPTSVHYLIVPTFLTESSRYPNGTLFSPKDIVAADILQAVITEQQLSQTVIELGKAVYVQYSYGSIADDEIKYQARLQEISALGDIRRFANKSIKSIHEKSRTGLELVINVSQLGISVEDGKSLARAIVDRWVNDAVASGLLNMNVQWPAKSFKANQDAPLLDSYDDAEMYLRSLEKTIKDLNSLSGVNALVVDGFKLSDVRHELEQLANSDIRPLRKYAYSNSNALVESVPEIGAKFYSRKRLMKLEQERLAKSVHAYDDVLVKINQSAARDTGSANIGQAGGAQIDQTFLSSILDIGSKLGSNDLKKEIHERRSQAISKMLNLEKEIAVLEEQIQSNEDISPFLREELMEIESALNTLQLKVKLLIDGYRSKVLKLDDQLYLSGQNFQITGGMLGLLKSFAKYVLLGLLLGGMIGVVVAICLLARGKR